MTEIPQPEDIYRRTKAEGARRLERPLLEVISTALAAGFDIVAGVVALGIVGARLEGKTGVGPAHVVASLAFGIGFIFLVVGRGELFTENFLVPITAVGSSAARCAGGATGSCWPRSAATRWATTRPAAACRRGG